MRFAGGLLACLALPALLMVPGVVAQDVPVSALVPRGPITLHGDGPFTPLDGVLHGTGSPSDPYVIAYWQITSEDSLPHAGIEILSSSHFRIHNVSIGGVGTHGLEILAAAGVTAENITVAMEDHLFAGVKAHYAGQVYLRDVVVQGGAFDAIDLGTSDAVTLERVRVETDGGRGITVERTPSTVLEDVMVRFSPEDAGGGGGQLGVHWAGSGPDGYQADARLEARGITVEGARSGMFVFQGTHAELQDITVRNGNSSAGDALALVGPRMSRGLPMPTYTLSGLDVADWDGIGLDIRNNATVHIEDVRIVATDGVFMRGGAGEVRLTQVDVEGRPGFAPFGIWMEAMEDVWMADVEVTGVPGARGGVYAFQPGELVIDGLRSDLHGGAGIMVHGNGSRMVLSDVEASGNGGEGILVAAGGLETRITNSVFHGNSKSGMRIAHDGAVHLTDVQADGNGDDGIRLIRLGSVEASLEGLKARDNAGLGIAYCPELAVLTPHDLSGNRQGPHGVVKDPLCVAGPGMEPTAPGGPVAYGRPTSTPPPSDPSGEAPAQGAPGPGVGLALAWMAAAALRRRTSPAA